MSEFKKGDIVIITDETLTLQRGTRIGVITEKGVTASFYCIKLSNRNVIEINDVHLKPIDYTNIVVMVDNEGEYNEIAQILGMTEPYDNDNLIYPDWKKKGKTGNSKIQFKPMVSAIGGQRDCIDYNEFMYFLKDYYTTPKKENGNVLSSIMKMQENSSKYEQYKLDYITSLKELKEIYYKEIDSIDNKLKELNNGKA